MIHFFRWGGRVVAAALFLALLGGIRAHAGGAEVRFHVAFGLATTMALILVHALGMMHALKLTTPLRELESGGAGLNPTILAAIAPRKEIVGGALIVILLALIAPIIALTALDGHVPRWTHGAIAFLAAAAHIVLWQRQLEAILRARMIIEAIEQELAD